MKKIAILGLMFFINFSQIFADENLDKFENISFSWQLFYYHGNNQEIDFIKLNPIFFNNKNYLLNYYVYINQIYNLQNNSSQNNRNVQSSTQEDNWGLFILRIIAESLAVYYNYNRNY